MGDEVLIMKAYCIGEAAILNVFACIWCNVEALLLGGFTLSF